MSKRNNNFIPYKTNITKHLCFFLVGGFIRDKIMQILNPEKDWVIINSTFKEMFKLNFKLVGKDFPVFLHPINKEEFALARKEKKIQVGYKGFKCYFSKNIILQNDIYRRDLSMNAITMSSNGKIIDTFEFKEYIKNKIIKHVSNAFSEDPLRILRVARFWCKYYKNGFLVSSNTFFLIKKLTKTDELKFIPKERIIKETNKANKNKNIKPYLFFLYMTNALKITESIMHEEIQNTKLLSINTKFNRLQKINNITKYINNYSNNNNLKQLILINAYNNLKKYKLQYIMNFYKTNYIMSKKNVKTILTLILLKIISKNILTKYDYIINRIIQKLKIHRDIIKIINIILLIDAKEKNNNQINIFYKKYIILDILNDECKFKNNKTKLKKIIEFYKKLYIKF